MRFFLAAALLLLASNINARSAQEYLPQDAQPDPGIPTPESVLGWEVGDWHVSHDKLVQYMQALAAASPRVSIKVTGYTYEQRPLLQLAITSTENQEKLESLRQQHLQGKGPLVVWLGYSVHGDEASGSNASMLAAYYLASSQSAYVRELLEGSVILIDPSINPDGLNRFASWVNSNAGKMPVSDPETRQHVQDWPKGRTNHYWFDLNRDWLPLVHPESRARIVEYHRWLPHVLTDHHEQGRFPGFFFQPGVPSRQNPLTPDENLELTRALAQYHSRAMDRAGQPYFTEEAYDDFYFGKGSTYPDINGSIGILFEQKSILGQQIETSNGVETFRMAIANQLRMSLSSLEGSWALREQLKTYQSGFHDLMLKRAASRNFNAWIVGDDGDPARARAFLDLLDLHRIEYQPLGESVRSGSDEFSPGHAWIIPARQ
ncbi:M14 family zinc carboxypeptidase, partial [Pseudomonadota bacterium]